MRCMNMQMFYLKLLLIQNSQTLKSMISFELARWVNRRRQLIALSRIESR